MKAATTPSRRSPAAGSVSKCKVCSCARAKECAAQEQNQSGPAPASTEPCAEALSPGLIQEDRFHLNCVVAQVWLVQLRRHTETRYLASADASRPLLQTGYARRSFSILFEPPTAIEAVRLFENLLRFANYESAAPARSFFLAYAPLAFEHDASGEYIGPGVWSPQAGSKQAATRVRRTLQRWCDWLEALMHFQIHEHHGAGNPRREFDQTIIFLWPLLNRHQWNALDLLTVLRALLNGSTSAACQSPAQLIGYCRAALGLCLPDRPTAVEQGVLPGQAVAERLFRFLPAIG